MSCLLGQQRLKGITYSSFCAARSCKGWCFCWKILSSLKSAQNWQKWQKQKRQKEKIKKNWNNNKKSKLCHAKVPRIEGTVTSFHFVFGLNSENNFKPPYTGWVWETDKLIHIVLPKIHYVFCLIVLLISICHFYLFIISDRSVNFFRFIHLLFFEESQPFLASCYFNVPSISLKACCPFLWNSSFLR